MKALRVSGFCWLSILCVFDAGQPLSGVAGTIIDSPATWRYLDDGRDLGMAWTEILYDDTGWLTGRSPLGYGEPNLSTAIGTNAITTYYRRTFYIVDPAALSDLVLYVRRDDGVRVFLNGVEIFRDNLSATARYDTLANFNVEPGVIYRTEVVPSLLRPGRNVLAAELHQAQVFSSDAFFDCWLVTSSEFPQIVITAPQDRSAVRAGRDLRIESELTGENNPVERVECFAGDVLLGQDYEPPYSVIWSNVPLGSFILRAVATSPGGATFVSPDVRITAVTNVFPQGWITSITNFQTLEEGTNILEAVGTDPDGSIALVEFFSDGTKIGEDDAAPFSVAWTNGTVGVHLLTARFIDNEGAITNTPPINVRVVTGPVLVRGPYLQVGTTQSIVVRWRTLFQRNSEVRYGTNVTELHHAITQPELRTEHEVELSGLAPGTKYYYSVGHSTETLREGADYFFVTHPAEAKPTRVWVIGDSGIAGPPSRQIFNRYRSYTGSRATDLWLMLGDNAYYSGTDQSGNGWRLLEGARRAESESRHSVRGSWVLLAGGRR
jgi:hypothetical protein